MDIRKLQRAIVDGLEDVKAQNIAVFNTEHLSALFERVIIASGTSNRQTKSLAGSVREAVKQAGAPVPRTEGEANGEWIIVDCGAAVVHVMQPAIRDYYRLEEIWGDKPVNMKLAAETGTRLVKAAEPDAPAPKAKAPAKRAAAKTSAVPAAPPKAPAKKAAAKKATAKSGAAAAPPAAAKKAARKAPVQRTTGPRGGVVTRVIGVTAPTKKAAAKKPAPARKAPAKKAAPRRP